MQAFKTVENSIFSLNIINIDSGNGCGCLTFGTTNLQEMPSKMR